MKSRRKRWARKYLSAGVVGLAALALVYYVFLVLIGSTFFGLLAVILVTVLLLPTALGLILDAFLWSYLDVYDNGLILPERSLLHVLRGRRERFLPFQSIKAAITNTRRPDAPNVALYVGDKEVLIDKRDIHDLEAFEAILRKKVAHVFSEPPSDAALDEILEGNGQSVV